MWIAADRFEIDSKEAGERNLDARTGDLGHLDVDGFVRLEENDDVTQSQVAFVRDPCSPT